MHIRTIWEFFTTFDAEARPARSAFKCNWLKYRATLGWELKFLSKDISLLVFYARYTCPSGNIAIYVFVWKHMCKKEQLFSKLKHTKTISGQHWPAIMWMTSCFWNKQAWSSRKCLQGTQTSVFAVNFRPCRLLPCVATVPNGFDNLR